MFRRIAVVTVLAVLGLVLVALTFIPPRATAQMDSTSGFVVDQTYDAVWGNVSPGDRIETTYFALNGNRVAREIPAARAGSQRAREVGHRRWLRPPRRRRRLRHRVPQRRQRRRHRRAPGGYIAPLHHLCRRHQRPHTGNRRGGGHHLAPGQPGPRQLRLHGDAQRLRPACPPATPSSLPIASRSPRAPPATPIPATTTPAPTRWMYGKATSA